MTSRASALKHFKKVDPYFYNATKAHHTSLPLQLVAKYSRAQLFASLVRIVISQQLATSAADTIYARVKKASAITPDALIKTSTQKLRRAGLSGSKIKAIKSIARAVLKREIDLLALGALREDVASEQLLRVWGLGPWSVEMFLMFSLGRQDVFSFGDLGLMRSIETLYKLPKNASRDKLSVIVNKWSPYRTYASLLLWRTRDANR